MNGQRQEPHEPTEVANEGGGMARTPRIHPAYRSYFLGSVVSAASWSRSPVFHTFTPVSLARGAAATEGSREPCNECSEGSGDPHPPSLSVACRPPARAPPDATVRETVRVTE